MKIYWGFIALLLLIFSSPVQAENAGMIKTVSGNVHIRRDDTRIIAIPGTPLAGKDVIITGSKAYAGLLFTDGTAVTIGSQTEFRIDTYIFAPRDGAYYFSFYLKKGSAIYNSGKIGKLSPQSVKLSTPKATVGIRGTRFIIDVN
jgi:hypothetical protein